MNIPHLELFTITYINAIKISKLHTCAIHETDTSFCDVIQHFDKYTKGIDEYIFLMEKYNRAHIFHDLSNNKLLLCDLSNDPQYKIHYEILNFLDLRVDNLNKLPVQAFIDMYMNNKFATKRVIEYDILSDHLNKRFKKVYTEYVISETSRGRHIKNNFTLNINELM
jgi:hypothetical protein